MSTPPTGPPEMATTTLNIKGDDWHLQARVTFPTGPTRLGELLPMVRSLSDAVVSDTVRAIEESGEEISCKKGCGACCRNLVAISEPEARRIALVVNGFPEPRRSEVLARFADARRRLEQAGLLEKLQKSEEWTDEDYTTLTVTYFRQQIACPFLEEESCSIYEERPITCREYLVTTPAENCAKVEPGTVKRVRLPLRVFNAVARWQVPPTEHFLERWVPLILAPEWAQAHPDDPPPKPGLDLLLELISHMSGKGPTAEKI